MTIWGDTVESQFLEPLREVKIGSRNMEIKMQCLTEGIETTSFWLELLGIINLIKHMKNQGLEKSGLHLLTF